MNRKLKIQEAIYSVTVDWIMPDGSCGERISVIVRGRATMMQAMRATEQWIWAQKRVGKIRSACLLSPEDIQERSYKVS